MLLSANSLVPNTILEEFKKLNYMVWYTLMHYLSPNFHSLIFFIHKYLAQCSDVFATVKNQCL